jgi:DNA helicase TIP49 (TBP-interacting protein)
LSLDICEERYQWFNEKLKGKQREAMNYIRNAIDKFKVSEKCVFLDGPGGSGKTFVYTCVTTSLVKANVYVV